MTTSEINDKLNKLREVHAALLPSSTKDILASQIRLFETMQLAASQKDKVPVFTFDAGKVACLMIDNLTKPTEELRRIEAARLKRERKNLKKQTT